MASTTLHTKGPANVDSLLATTRELILESKELLNDAIFNKIPLLNWLNTKARVSKQGGASILIPLLYGKNNTFAAYNGDDIISTQGQEGMTMAQFPWRNIAGTIKYNGDEIRQNAGQGKLKDLAKAKVVQAMMSAKDKLSTDLNASTQASKAVSCLPVLVDATSTVADINSTTYSWWGAQVTASGSFAARGLADLRTLRDNIMQNGQGGTSAPDYYLTTALVKQYYEASQVPQLRYENNSAADASFDNLKFSAGVMEFDPNVASGELYALNSESLEFVVHSDADWAMGEFIEPANQDAKIAKLIWMGNLCTNNRRKLGKLTGVTA